MAKIKKKRKKRDPTWVPTKTRYAVLASSKYAFTTPDKTAITGVVGVTWLKVGVDPTWVPGKAQCVVPANSKQAKTTLGYE